DFHPGSDSFDTHGDDWEEFKLDRAVYRFDLGKYIASQGNQPPITNLIIEGGRQYVHWFNGLVFSGEFDGVLVNIDHDKLGFKGLAGTSTRRTIDIDSARPNYDTDTHRDFFAGALTYRVNENHTPFIYGLVQQDHNDTGSYFDGTTTTEFDYESWYLGVGSKGSFSDQLLYNLEFVYQGGRGMSGTYTDSFTTVNQTKEDISAWALAMNLAYQFKSENYTRVDGEIILASGDGDRVVSTSSSYGGNQPGSNDTAFNGFGSMNTGLAFAPEVSNLMMLRMGASTFPLINHETFKRLQVGTNVYLYGKLNKNAPIDETTGDHTFLGVETDFFANWQISHDLSMAVRYGIFFGGDALTENSHPRNFFFTSMTLAF
ncbi:MAG: alginate export family protein, partial [Phycisphaeraceae bacterium JB051]